MESPPLLVYVSQSRCRKPTPFRKGPLCAVQAMMAYLSVRGSAPGPLFRLQDGRPLSRVLLTDWLRQIFSAAGLSFSL